MCLEWRDFLEGELVTDGQLEHLVLEVLVTRSYILLLHDVGEAEDGATIDVDGDGGNLIRNTLDHVPGSN